MVLAESPKYTGLRLDEAPRNMGDGFVVLASNDVNLYYYMDEARVNVFVLLHGTGRYGTVPVRYLYVEWRNRIRGITDR